MTDLTLLEHINNLLTQRQPESLKHIDLLIVAYLLASDAHKRAITDSWDIIATRLHCDRRTIGTSFKRLEALGWITQRNRYMRSSRTTLNLDALQIEVAA
jgi:hypothetical protein